MPEQTWGETLAQQTGGQAASGVVAGGINRLFRAGDNRAQLKQQGKLQAQQIQGMQQMGIFNREQQMQMWHDTNAEAQMKHFKNAGLNPALMYGNATGAGGSTAATPGHVDGGQASQGMGIASQGMSAQILTAAQIELMKAQARNLNVKSDKEAGVDTDLTRTQNNVLQTENELKKLDLKKNQETLWDEIWTIASNRIKAEEEANQAGFKTTVDEATVKDNIDRIKAEAINTAIQGEVMKQGIKLSEAQIDKLAADIVQRGQEIAIHAFVAETQANQPGIGQVIGSMANSIKSRVDKILGLGKDFTKPKQIGK